MQLQPSELRPSPGLYTGEIMRQQSQHNAKNVKSALVHLYVYILVSELSVLKVNIYTTKLPFLNLMPKCFLREKNKMLTVYFQIYSLTGACANVRDLLNSRHFDTAWQEEHRRD